jgi:hypothetical protein
MILIFCNAWLGDAAPRQLAKSGQSYQPSDAPLMQAPQALECEWFDDGKQHQADMA